jgi:orotidine-5'-phosphate decarboxylase
MWRRIKEPPSIISALDVSFDVAKKIAYELDKITHVSGLKIGSMLVMEHGLKVCQALKSNVPVILDMQKGATDIPEIVREQVKLAASYDVDAFIGSPLGAGSGRGTTKQGTLEAFVSACMEYSVIPIVVLEMTQPGATYFIRESACEELAQMICGLEIPYVVAPATKPERITLYREIFERESADVEIISPGVGPQRTGDPLKDSAEAVRHGADHVVIGRAIYKANNPANVALKIGGEIQKAFRERKQCLGKKKKSD